MKIRIAFIGGKTYPIPDVKGGAMQALVTAILQQNEVCQDFLIDVYTGFDSRLKAEQCKYKLTRINAIKIPPIAPVYDVFWRAISKLTKHRISTRSWFMSRVNHCIKNEHYDYIILESSDKEIREIERYNEAKIWFHVHSDYLKHSDIRTREALEKCDKLVGVSEYITHRISGHLFGNKAVTLANAIDVGAYTKGMSREKIIELREKMGYGCDDKIVIFCGRLSPEKGCLELIKAVVKTPACKLIVVGGENFSSDKETEYTKKLKEAAAKAKERIIFTGYVPHEDVHTYFAIADIGVVPSVCNEAAPLTLLEMRASGLATIASHRGGIPEHASREGTVLIDTDEAFVDNLARTISFLCNDNKRLALMKQTARKELNAFDYSSYYQRFLSLILDDMQ